MMQRDFEVRWGRVWIRERERDRENQKDFHIKSGINKCLRYNNLDLHTLSSSISLGYFTVLICEGELRDKLNMTYAPQAESERADVCKNTQGAEGRLRG